MIDIINSMCNDMGMIKNNDNNLFGCGSFFQGMVVLPKGIFGFCLMEIIS